MVWMLSRRVMYVVWIVVGFMVKGYRWAVRHWSGRASAVRRTKLGGNLLVGVT